MNICFKTLTGLTLTAALSGTALANEQTLQKPAKILTNTVVQDDLVAIPMDLRFDVKQAVKIERDLEEDFNKNNIPVITYDNVLGDFDANIGILKDKKTNSRIKSGALPRGRFLESSKSKLGAGISRKF